MKNNNFQYSPNTPESEILFKLNPLQQAVILQSNGWVFDYAKKINEEISEIFSNKTINLSDENILWDLQSEIDDIVSPSQLDECFEILKIEKNNFSVNSSQWEYAKNKQGSQLLIYDTFPVKISPTWDIWEVDFNNWFWPLQFFSRTAAIRETAKAWKEILTIKEWNSLLKFLSSNDIDFAEFINLSYSWIMDNEFWFSSLFRQDFYWTSSINEKWNPYCKYFEFNEKNRGFTTSLNKLDWLLVRCKTN